MNEFRVALLVDGENLPVTHAGLLIIEAAKLGTVCVKRVYGAIPHLGDWNIAPGFRLIHTPSAKNAADIALSLDALELALTRQIDAVVLATSDRDMAFVALRLAELGVPVTGIGEEKASDHFRKACRTFIKIAGEGQKPASEKSAVPAQPKTTQAAPKPVAKAQDTELKKQRAFQARLKGFFDTEGDINGWVSLNTLGQAKAKEARISKAEAGLAKSKSWLTWFKNHMDSYELEERGTQSRARLRSKENA